MFAIGKSKKLVKYSNFRFDQFFVRFEMEEKIFVKLQKLRNEM